MYPIRENVLKHLIKITEESNEICEDIEKSIFNWCIDYSSENNHIRSWNNKIFKSIYMNKARSVLVNLDPNSYIGNKTLLKRLKNKELKPYDISYMDSPSIYPDKWRTIIEKRLKTEETFHTSQQIAQTDLFKCGKCKERKTSYRELQIRSCDEPASLLISCLNCGHKWKIG